MHAVKIDENRGHEFKGKQGKEYGRVPRKEREGKDAAIIISKIKKIIHLH